MTTRTDEATAVVTAVVTALERRAWHETVMGMPLSVHLRGPHLGGTERAVAAVITEMHRLDRIFSPYRPDSELRRYEAGHLTLRDCSPEMTEVVDLCKLATALTGGDFDARRPLPGGGLTFDPSGLVKGWAVDRASRHLCGLGVDWYVNAGGDIAAHVADEERPAWQVGIQDPADRSRVIALVSLRDGGVATSGTSARGEHLWDPHTGEAARGCASVTVVGPTLTWADVLATAVFVHGPEAAEWVAEDGYEVIVVHRDGRAERTLPRVPV
ncbi:MAG: FAD:protein FMN transferase [Actinomycetales bacterium]|nr:FAD:protein FMN transferase [Actinomycetales bacterium]